MGTNLGGAVLRLSGIPGLPPIFMPHGLYHHTAIGSSRDQVGYGGEAVALLACQNGTSGTDTTFCGEWYPGNTSYTFNDASTNVYNPDACTGGGYNWQCGPGAMAPYAGPTREQGEPFWMRSLIVKLQAPGAVEIGVGGYSEDIKSPPLPPYPGPPTIAHEHGCDVSTHDVSAGMPYAGQTGQAVCMDLGDAYPSTITRFEGTVVHITAASDELGFAIPGSWSGEHSFTVTNIGGAAATGHVMFGAPVSSPPACTSPNVVTNAVCGPVPLAGTLSGGSKTAVFLGMGSVNAVVNTLSMSGGALPPGCLSGGTNAQNTCLAS